jgi:hypothetical protein
MIQCILQCVLNGYPKFVQSINKTMTMRKLRDVMFNHLHFVFTILVSLLAHVEVDFYCSVVTHYTKMLSIFVHCKSHIFAKCENMTCKTSYLLQQQSFSPFMTLFLLGQKLEYLLKATCQTPNLPKMLLQSLTTPSLLSLNVRICSGCRRPQPLPYI